MLELSGVHSKNTLFRKMNTTVLNVSLEKMSVIVRDLITVCLRICN